MNWFEAFGLTIATIAIVAGFIFLPIFLVGLTDRIIESIRKNKHPEYFEYYNTAVSESFRIGGELGAKKKRIEHYIKLYGEGYRDGECTAESITKKMSEITQWWITACDDYNKEQESIKVLWQKADAYAKEHNLKWGIIYESK